MDDSESGTKLSYDNAFVTSLWSRQLRVLFLLPLALAMAACSYAPNVHMPYRIERIRLTIRRARHQQARKSYCAYNARGSLIKVHL